MERKVAFVTNAAEYAGRPAVDAMLGAGWQVFCHDRSFAEPSGRSRFETEHPGAIAAEEAEVAAFAAAGLARFGRVDALISNDVPGAERGNLRSGGHSDRLDQFEAFVDSLLLEPVRLLRAALPAMKSARSGSVILVTSGAPLRVPLRTDSFGYVAARAGANTLAQALALDLAPLGIQVNAVAPFYVYNQTFFPSEIGAADPKFADELAGVIPMQRFGNPAEIGELIALLARGKAGFVSGQVIAFSGAAC